MASSYLWVHVKEARVTEPDPNIRSDVQVLLQVGSSPPFITAKASSPNPKWEEDVMLTIPDADVLKGSINVELFKPKFLFRKELLGKATLPLYSVRHSNKPDEGYWLNLFLPSSSDSPEMPTQHRIRLDTHFELPKDIPPEVVELLENRLESLNNVLEQEAEILEDQEHKLITGAISPPPAHAAVTHEVEEVVAEPVMTAPFQSTPPYQEAASFHSTPYSDTRMELDSSQGFADSSPLPSEDFPDGGGGGGGSWNNSPGHSSFDHQHELEELGQDVSIEFENFEWDRRDALDPVDIALSAKRHSQPEVRVKRVAQLSNAPRAASMDERVSPRRREGSQRVYTQEGEVVGVEPPAIPTVIVSSALNEGASASGRGSISKDVSDFNFRHGHGAAVAGSVEDLSYEAAKAKVLWQGALEKLLPEIRSKRNVLPAFGTLSQLVDQLKSYKMKSKLISEQNIGTFSSTNSQFRSRSRSVLDVKKKIMYRKHYVDERVKMDVYKQTLEALLYPASEPDSHSFEIWSAMKPTTCSECNYLLWGLKKQGVKCTRCGKICHERCASLSNQDCFMHNQHSAISDKMHRMQVNHSNRFDILLQAFSYSQEKHDMFKEEVEGRILKMAETFSADISITVVAAQGLLIPKNLSHRIYVSVAVGNMVQKTDVFRKREDDKSSPSWDRELSFKCENYHDAIQFRVWNERDSAMAKMANKLTKEGDLFLGQKIIEVRRVGTSQEVWYKLEKRTEKGPDVSGHIKVNIKVSVEGESSTPFHQMYIKLHEQMFFHCHVNSEMDLVLVSDKLNPSEHAGSMQLLPIVAQEVVDEFALRYAIEPIFRMMVHIELLVSHHSMRSALVVINNMLKNLKYQMFIHVAADHAARAVGATTLMEEYMDASNFGRDKFSKLLDKLLNSLRLDLQQYREFYPHKDEHKLKELVETFELMSTVIEFQQQAMGDSSSVKASELILESMKECLKNTFDFIVQSNMVEDYAGHPGMDANRAPFDFFYQIIIQMKSVILEDRTVYGKFLPKYCKVNFGDVSAVELWHLFSSTVEGLFDNDAYLEVFPPTEYITLLFTIKTFYDSELRSIPSRQGKVPEFPRWFVRCVQRWLNLQYQKDGMFFLDNAWDDDKNRLKFEAHENQKLSSSAFQMFVFLHQGLEFVLSLEGGDVEVKEQHFEDFSMIIVHIVQHYVDKISVTMPEYIGELNIMCMLLNNLQALRSNIHGLFEGMGGNRDAGAGASRVLTEFQSVLSKQLTSWCGFVAKSLHSHILNAARTVQDALMKIKGQGSMERSQVKEIVRPLFDLLTERLSVIALTSEQFILQKVIKEVWYVCMECIHHMLLPSLKLDHEGVQAAPTVDFPLHHFTGRQCTALEIMMELLRDFFQAAESHGIKMSTIERGIKQLKAVISLYRETTERLITDYIAEEVKGGLKMTDMACGEVYLAIDAYPLPSTGELDGTIRVISACNLKGLSGTGGSMRPMIELIFISPTSSQHKRRFATHVAKSSQDPHFNETFKFTLTNWEVSELMVLAKHHSTFQKDRVIGLAIVSCSTLNDQASLTLSLGSCCVVTDMGQAITNVLSARTYDEFAQDFIAVKKSHRSEMAEDVEDTDKVVDTVSRGSTPPKKTGLLAGLLK